MAAFKILAQRQTSELTPDGRFIDVMEVSFEIETGDTGVVRVPVAVYTAASVAAAVSERAAQMLAVAALEG